MGPTSYTASAGSLRPGEERRAQFKLHPPELESGGYLKFNPGRTGVPSF